MNLMNLHQDTFQDIQELKDQYMAMNRVCDELELLFGRFESDARAVSRKKG